MTSPSVACPRIPVSAAAEEPSCDPTGLADILTEIAAGNSTRFSEFYVATHSTVYGSVRRLLLCPEQSAEVTQEVYLQVWIQAARFDRSRCSALGWLTVIARRRAVDRVRQARAAVLRDDAYVGDHTTSDVGSVWCDVVQRSDAEVLRCAVDQLSPVQREALVLMYFRGHTAVEVAGLLNRPVGTVKTRIRDGLISLRRALVPGYVDANGSSAVATAEVGFLPVRTETCELRSVA